MSSLNPSDPPVIEALPGEHDVVLLPQEIDGDIGIYRDEQTMVVKELRAQGVDAAFLHDSEHRHWLALKGSDIVIPLIVQFGVSFLASGSWELVANLLRGRFGKATLAVKFGRTRELESGTETEWFEAEGDGDAVAEALRILAKGDDKPAGD